MRTEAKVAHEMAELLEALLVFIDIVGGLRIRKIFYDRHAYRYVGEDKGIRIELDEKSTEMSHEELFSDSCPLRLNVRSGDAFLSGQKICTLRKNTLPFHYLSFLVQQFPNAASYEEISKNLRDTGVTINRKTEDRVGAQAFCFALKNQIKLHSSKLAGQIIHTKGFARIRT